jgi:hypothetical protein
MNVRDGNAIPGGGPVVSILRADRPGDNLGGQSILIGHPEQPRPPETIMCRPFSSICP